MEKILITVAAILIGFGFYMMIRNERVYQYRTNLLDNKGMDSYFKLPSYDKMVFNFWIWPLSKFEDYGDKK